MTKQMQNKTTTKFGRVGVLYGGDNSEREVSLRSGESVYDALKSCGVDVVKIDTKNNLLKQIQENKITTAFIVLHGRDGEDGVIQGFLKYLNIPYTGSDTGSSALAMNKAHCKSIAKGLNIDTASFKLVNKNTLFNSKDSTDYIAELDLPLFVKPVREGSSVGMSKASTPRELIDAVKLAQKYDDVLVEKFIDGKEYTVSILNGKALPSISMETPNEFYDYEAKYLSNKTEYYCPSGLSEKEEMELQGLAVKIFDAIGCKGWGRVDFIRETNTNKFMLLEVNTVPGMTSTSLVPKAAAAVGLDYQQLVLEILESALLLSKDSLSEVTHG